MSYPICPLGSSDSSRQGHGPYPPPCLPSLLPPCLAHTMPSFPDPAPPCLPLLWVAAAERPVHLPLQVRGLQAQQSALSLETKLTDECTSSTPQALSLWPADTIVPTTSDPSGLLGAQCCGCHGAVYALPGSPLRKTKRTAGLGEPFTRLGGCFLFPLTTKAIGLNVSQEKSINQGVHLLNCLFPSGRDKAVGAKRLELYPGLTSLE